MTLTDFRKMEHRPSFQALSQDRSRAPHGDQGYLKDESRLIAFYLPQFHRIPENDEWWGPGFTEWTNVARARPNFPEHYQPHIPADLGFYDLSHIETMREQVELAKIAGVHGFCFYHYWFSGRRILEKPFDNFLASDIEFPFCLCWANENWTRTWDGDAKSVLLAQQYAEEDAPRLIESLLPAFQDKRYIRIKNKPLLVIYRIKEIPDPRQTIAAWRQRAHEAGLDGLYVAAVDFYDISHPDEVGADALVEFPPHKFNYPNNCPDYTPTISNPDFAGHLLDYRKMVLQSARRPTPDFTLFRGIIPSWDNTARRQDTPTTVINSSPALFGAWLSYLRAYSRHVHTNRDARFVFINAWNEWAEGCHLEPDVKNGHAFLAEIERSAWFDSQRNDLEIARCRLEQIVMSDAAHEGDSIRRFTDKKTWKPAPPWISSISNALESTPWLRTIAKKVYNRLFRSR